MTTCTATDLATADLSAVDMGSVRAALLEAAEVLDELGAASVEGCAAYRQAAAVCADAALTAVERVTSSDPVLGEAVRRVSTAVETCLNPSDGAARFRELAAGREVLA